MVANQNEIEIKAAPSLQNSHDQSLSCSIGQGFEKGKWLQIGAGSASGSGISSPVFGLEQPALAVGSDGHPLIALPGDETGRAEIFVHHWDGEAWNDMGLDYSQW